MGRRLDRFQDSLNLHAIVKARFGHAVVFQAGQEVVYRVNEGVLPAYRVAHGPPCRDIGVIALQDGKSSESSLDDRRGAVVPFQLVQAFQVESQTSIAAINVERVRIAPAGAEARCREHAGASVAEPG